jgi:hypothetical protein
MRRIALVVSLLALTSCDTETPTEPDPPVAASMQIVSGQQQTDTVGRELAEPVVVLRLGGRGLAAVAGGLTALEWGVLLVCGGFFVYGEGVLALQRKWVPLLAERAKAVRDESSGLLHLMAPLYGMSLIGAARGQVLRSWAMVAAILVAVRIVGVLPEPWRGIIDLSVAAALVWGLAAIASAAPSVLRS